MLKRVGAAICNPLLLNHSSKMNEILLEFLSIKVVLHLILYFSWKLKKTSAKNWNLVGKGGISDLLLLFINSTEITKIFANSLFKDVACFIIPPIQRKCKVLPNVYHKPFHSVPNFYLTHCYCLRSR